MKRIFLSMAVVATIGLTSCGGDDVCGCLEEAQKMGEEAGDDKDKQKAAADKAAECIEMTEGMSEDELKDLDCGEGKEE